ncbi:huntingtin-interacting protein M isoform X2 [Erinaceus europaeus]|uniref:Huntingtin-interacting protein M isoform X2 n=1 Tax=Erinaceus europaeus TaxID=9365 RepID=A0A1S2ZR48_ERIEU|nr:huntingtin-interacting protein M isoform X2 [Erinaceus europaeus]
MCTTKKMLAIQEDQRSGCLNSSSPEFLLIMLDYLTDYILELVGTEASSSNGQLAPVNETPADNRLAKDVTFSLFDEMPGSRKNG